LKELHENIKISRKSDKEWLLKISGLCEIYREIS
jgi:hypothetical protein